MAIAITVDNLFNPFEAWREILTGITTLKVANSSFSRNENYYEFDPRPMFRDFEGYPFFLIETNCSDEPVSMKCLQQMNYSTDLKLHSIFAAKDNTKTYMRHLLKYLNSNKTALLSSYNINITSIKYNSDKELENGRNIATGTITVNYTVLLDVES